MASRISNFITRHSVIGQTQVQNSFRAISTASNMTTKDYLRGSYTMQNATKKQITTLQALATSYQKAVLPGVQSFGGLLRNVSLVNQALKHNSAVGIASANSIMSMSRNAKTYTANARGMLSSMDKMRIMSHTIGTNVNSLAKHYQALGTKLQWTGRQMTIGLTTPMVVGSIIAVKSWNKVNDELTRLKKVVTDKEFRELGGGKNTKQASENLINIARQLGHEFAVVDEMVIAVMADFAAMGYTTRKELVAMTELSLKMASLGDVDISDSTKVVRTVMEQFGRTTENTTDILAAFNAIENETAIGLKDLVPSFPQVAAAAEAFGLSAQETAAAMAAMYEQGIPASEVAHSLKYALTSLISPTKETRDAVANLQRTLPKAGNTLAAISEGALRGREGLVAFAQAYQEIATAKGPTEAQEILVGIVGKRQTARIGALFKSINLGEKELADANRKNVADYTSDWARATKAAGVSFETLTSNRKKMERELAVRQKSDAFRYKQAIRDIKSEVAKFGQELAPILQGIAIKIGDIMQGFGEFLKANPGLQKTIVHLGLILAVLGPLTMGLALTQIATASVARAFSFLIPTLGYAAKGFLNVADAALIASKKQFDLFGAQFAATSNFSQNIKKLKEMLFGIKAVDTATSASNASRAQATATISANTQAYNANTTAIEANIAAQVAAMYGVPAAGAAAPAAVAAQTSRLNAKIVNAQTAAFMAPSAVSAITGLVASEADDVMGEAAQAMDARAKARVKTPGWFKKAAPFSAVPAPILGPKAPIKIPFGKHPLDLIDGAVNKAMYDDIMGEANKLMKPSRYAPKKGLFGKMFGMTEKSVAKGGAMGKMLKPINEGLLKMTQTSGILSKIPFISSILGIGPAAGGATVGAFTGLAAIIVALIPVLAKLSGHWESFWSGVKAGAKPALDFLKSSWSAIKDALMSLWNGIKAIWQPFKKLLNSIMGVISGEDDGGKQKKAAAGWKKIGAIFGGVVTVLSVVVRILAEVIKIVAKILAFIAKVLGAIIGLIFKVMQLHLVFKPIGWIFKNWINILNVVIDTINLIIKGINKIVTVGGLIPALEIPLIPRITDMNQFKKDFYNLVNQVELVKDKKVLMETRKKPLIEELDTTYAASRSLQKDLAEYDKIFAKAKKKYEKQEIELQFEPSKLAAARRKFEKEIEDALKRRVEGAQGNIGAQEEIRNKLLEDEAGIRQKLVKVTQDLKRESATLAQINVSDPGYQAQADIVHQIGQEFNKLKNKAGEYRKEIQKVEELISKFQDDLPTAMSSFSEDSLYSLGVQQKQIDETQQKISKLKADIHTALYDPSATPALIKQLPQMKQQLAEAQTSLQGLTKARSNAIKEMYDRLPANLQKKISLEKFTAFINVEFKYDEFTAATTSTADRLSSILAQMPEKMKMTLSDADEAAIDAAQKFSDALKDALDDIVDKLKDNAIKSFEAGAQGRIDIIDQQIKAMEAAEKAEAELFETQQYYDNRRKMLNDFAITSENYRRNRALAIYEGRYDDARMMDLEYQSDTKIHQDNLSNLDDERNKTLIQKERDAQKERLNAQKDALEKELELQKQHFEDMLNVITEYTPRNVTELQNMIDQMNGYLGEQGFPLIEGTWTQGTDLWRQATEKAGANLADAAFWAGRGAAVAAVTGMLGINPEWQEKYDKLSRADKELYNQWLEGKINPFNMVGQNLGSVNARMGTDLLPSGIPREIFPPWWFESFHTGGMVGSPMSSPADIPAVLQSGEFVMQRRAVDKLGIGFLSSLNKYHEGGLVGGAATSMLKGNFAGFFNRMMAGGAGFFGLTVDNIKAIMAQALFPRMALATLPGTGGIGMPEAQPIQVPVDQENLIVTPFKEFLSGIFPEAAAAIMRGSTYREGPLVSFHASGQAVDIGDALSSQAILENIFEFLVPRVEKFDIVELIFRNLQFDKGPGWREYSGNDHYDHIHVAVGTRLGDLIATNPNFFTPLLRGGKVPLDNFPALLHKGEVVLPANIVRNIEAANQNGGGDTYICVDTFIGQRQWFESMMKEYNIKTLPAEQRRRGTMNRVVSSRKDNTVRYV